MTATTTTRLLIDLRDPENSTAWVDFDARYRPVLQGFAHKLGLPGHDADELAQQTLAEFCRSLRDGRYQRERGRLRAWLIGIARNVASSMRRKRNRAARGDSLLVELPGESELTRIWAEERERAIFEQAMHRLRSSSRIDPETLSAFELYAVQGVPVAEVAGRCGLSVDMVYVIKNRLTKRLREMVAELTAAYDEGE